MTYEFPGPNYATDKNDLVVVTYSSISTNQFENYGECVMGTHGTMVVERESNVMLYTEKDPNKNLAGEPKSMAVTVTSTAGGKASRSNRRRRGVRVVAADRPRLAELPCRPALAGLREPWLPRRDGKTLALLRPPVGCQAPLVRRKTANTSSVCRTATAK